MGTRADDGDGPRRTDGDAGARRERLRGSLRQLVLVVVAVAVVALAAGWLFARGDASGAARTLLREDVTVEEPPARGRGGDPALPTAGPDRGAPRCGRHHGPLPPAEQVATLAAGVVIVHHRDDLSDAVVADLEALADEHERVLVHAAEELPAPVVATAWGHRLEQETPDTGQLELFVTGWAGRGPDPRDCEEDGEGSAGAAFGGVVSPA